MKKKVHFLTEAVFAVMLFAVLSCGGGGGDGGDSPNLLGGGITYAIGGTGPGGGKIFYYDVSGFTVGTVGDGVYNGGTYHYLEAAPADVSGTVRWATIYWHAGTETGIGTGYANTAKVLGGNPDAPASKACKNYPGSKNDWFLPSKGELNLMYQYKATIGNFTTDVYWSSSEDNPGTEYALGQSFNDGTTTLYNKEGVGNKVRPIRAF